METNPRGNDAPTGLPDEQEPEPTPLGGPDPQEGAEPGADAMPGIADDDGEPPTSG
ncbi:MAG: hypothetical protein JWO90_2753 [Solirubrobacterales bacterium]|jgi:hypothetical protein|nr:hypothetical protein [Solirubrobacterales bacterium]